MNGEWFIGYCEAHPNGYHQRIAPVAKLRHVLGNALKIEPLTATDKAGFGPTGSVFWQMKPSSYVGSLVRFQTVENPAFGKPNFRGDRYSVSVTEKLWNLFLLKNRVVEIEDWQTARRTKGPKGATIFIRDAKSRLLIGPWILGDPIPEDPTRCSFSPLPGEKGKPRAFRLGDIPFDRVQKVFFSFQGRLVSEEFILDPPLEGAVPIDLATPAELADWIVEQIRILNRGPQRTTTAAIMDSLESMRAIVLSHPGPGQEVPRQRWDRIHSIFSEIQFDQRQLDAVLAEPHYQSQIEARLNDRIDARAEARVDFMADQLIDRAQQKAAGLIAGIEEMLATKQRLEREAIAEHEAFLSLIAQDTQKARAERDSIFEGIEAQRCLVAEKETRVSELLEHLEDSRERLLRDAVLLQPLFAQQKVSQPPEPPPSREPAPKTVVSPPILDQKRFARERLWPALACRFPGVAEAVAQVLHATVVGARAILVPDPSWVKVYADALGDSATVKVVYVSPVWLDFSDLCKGGFGGYWQNAIAHPDRIHLVVLRDFNRALPQCYARPLMDLLAGFIDELPHSASGGWPTNLRLFACRADGADAMPLTPEVVDYFAAVIPPVQFASPAPGSKIEGHVPAPVWSSWRTCPKLPPVLQPDVANFGSLAPLVEGDCRGILGVFTALNAQFPHHDFARGSRIDDPKTYATQSESGADR